MHEKESNEIGIATQFRDAVRRLSPSHSSVADTAGWCSAAELGLTSAESGCSPWSHSSESQTPAMALHRWQKNYKHCLKFGLFIPFHLFPLHHLPSWLVVMLTLSLAGSLPLS